MTAEQTRADPEVWHLIGLPSGETRGQMKLTATVDDGRIHREDGRGPWEPLHDDDGQPCWYRVSAEIADQWMTDDEDQTAAADEMRDVLSRIRREVSLPAGLAEAAIRAVEGWEHHR